jgi:hypothetical protein
MDDFNDNWDVWYHSINDNTWTKSSYQKIHQIKNLFDYRYVMDTFEQDHYQNGMFFCMKEDIFPNWEDPDNRNGGCLSFKIPSTDIIGGWGELLLKCFTETILSSTEYSDEINGISISPKKEFNIIKIWFKNATFEYKKHFHEESESLINLQNSLYKKHEL